MGNLNKPYIFQGRGIMYGGHAPYPAQQQRGSCVHVYPVGAEFQTHGENSRFVLLSRSSSPRRSAHQLSDAQGSDSPRPHPIMECAPTPDDSKGKLRREVQPAQLSLAFSPSPRTPGRGSSLVHRPGVSGKPQSSRPGGGIQRRGALQPGNGCGRGTVGGALDERGSAGSVAATAWSPAAASRRPEASRLAASVARLAPSLWAYPPSRLFR